MLSRQSASISAAARRGVARKPLLRRNAASLASLDDRTPVIVSYARTPIGRFAGGLAPLPAGKLGAVAVRAAVERAGMNVEKDGGAIDEAYIGIVLSSGVGQAPCTQAIRFAGLPDSIPATTVNKVCASGMKSIAFAADAIMLGRAKVVLAGGMESMSNVPHLLPSLRSGVRMGEGKLVDGMVHDGLWDVYSNVHMGSCAELLAEDHNITRDDQDNFAKASYERALSAEAIKLSSKEIVPVEVSAGRGKTIMVESDEEPGASDLSKLSKLRAAFKKDGTVTAGNASKLNDGAAAFIVMSAAEARSRGVKPLAAIRGTADSQQAPEWFTLAPTVALPKAVAAAGLKPEDIQLWEINEAFSVVGIGCARTLGLKDDIVNIHGGAVALGHPIGVSGARIVGHLAMLMQEKGVSLGAAGICNGGGGASAMVLEAVE